MKMLNQRFLCHSLGLVLISGLFFGCQTSREVAMVAPYSVAYIQEQAGPSPTQEKLIQKHCPFGEPKLNRSFNVGLTDLVARDGYVLLHSSLYKIPLWVCEYVEKSQLTGHATRDDKFAPDPLIQAGRRAELVDYVRTGYDRGHQAPAADQTTNPKLKAESFFLSNMAPQKPKLNRNIWKSLEEKARDWAKTRGSVYIITGPMFYDPKEEVVGKATGVVIHKVIGPHSVAVPTHFYKIVIGKNSAGKQEAIGFVMENTSYNPPYDFGQYIKPIEWIEKITGIDFMPGLDRDEKRQLEHTASPLWN
jgi:endonuclease G